MFFVPDNLIFPERNIEPTILIYQLGGGMIIVTVPGYSLSYDKVKGWGLSTWVYPQSPTEEMNTCIFRLLACIPVTFSTIERVQTPCTGIHAAHSKLSLPILISLIQIISHLTGQCKVDTISLTLASQVILGCVKLIKPTPNNSKYVYAT